MPPPTPKPRTYPPRPPRPPRDPALEVVDPVWLLKALAISFVAALLCGYATLCLLFYQGTWQLILHPNHIVDRTPATLGISYNDIHFDSTETGQPRLTAWWIPATPKPSFAPRHPTPTILYLHDATGSLTDTLPTLALLHSAGLNIFAIDYRGFGASDASQHPSEARMAEDTSAALTYLTETRHIPAATIVPYGSGLAASLAANLAHAHPTLPAVILDNPCPDPAAIALAAHPSSLIPVRLLFGNQFNVATPLASLATPKLLIDGGPTSPAVASSPTQPTIPAHLTSRAQPFDPTALQALFTHAPTPRTTLTLPCSTTSAEAYRQALAQFLDQYLPAH